MSGYTMDYTTSILDVQWSFMVATTASVDARFMLVPSGLAQMPPSFVLGLYQRLINPCL
jgi:hypothetical protein